MNAPTDLKIRLTSFAHGGGCGCKIAPGVLGEILKGAKGIVPPQLLVGIETADDAAVYQLNDEQALIATTDFFMPIVDDPYDFGRIAATNAISDVYAMGGTPIMALALLGMPINQLPIEVIRSIVEGGESVCTAAGIPIAGGHTIDSVEPIYGLVVLGLVHPRKVKRNSARAGGRRADPRQAARRRHLFRGAEEGRSRRGRLRADDRQHDEAQHARTQARRHDGGPCADRRHRLRPAGSPERDHPRQRPGCAAAPARDPAAAGRRRTRCEGFRHRRVRSQLGWLRASRRR